MEKIHINLGKDSYDIVIDSGLIRHAGDAVSSLTGAHDAAIITEDGIDRLYGMDLVKSLESAGIRAQMIVVPSSEKSRSLSIVNRVYGALVDFGLPSDGVLIALGGRVVGDITGFVAATYHRGIAYIQFPTSVLSQIGSAIADEILARRDVERDLAADGAADLREYGCRARISSAPSISRAPSISTPAWPRRCRENTCTMAWARP